MNRQKSATAIMMVICIVISYFGFVLDVNAQTYYDVYEDYIEIESQEIQTNKKKVYRLKNYDDNRSVSERNVQKGLLQNDVQKRERYSGANVGYIVGDDDRNEITNTTRTPYRYIGQLVSTFKRKNNTTYLVYGTAFLVGKSIILTCAHCVYVKGDTLVESYFYPAQNGYDNRPYKYLCSTVHIPTNYKNAVDNKDKNNQEKYDYALIQLKEQVGKRLGYFDLGGYNTDYNENYIVGKSCTLVGYPIEKDGRMYRQKGLIKKFNNPKYMMYYYNDTTNGQSGSPIIYPAPNGHYYVMGIHRGIDKPYNCARYITKNIYDLVVKWR
jgi:V8-like Glu-specific endopeptidase